MAIILLVNGNTNQVLTEQMVGQARSVALEGTRIVGLTPRFGERFVQNRAQEIVAAHAVLDAVETYPDPYDAVLVAISMDSAVFALRERLSVPVIGMTEASCHFAHMSGQFFSAVTADLSAIDSYHERIDAFGMGQKLKSIRGLGMTPQRAYDARNDIVERLAQLIESMLLEDGSESVVLLGVAFSGLERELRRLVKVPVFSGITCGTLMLDSVLKLNANDLN